jgi:acetoacetyl-CoA synthetase
VHGRSDSTLNRYGVRLGTGELYRIVDTMTEIKESLAIGLEDAGGGYQIVLFVVLAEGAVLDDALADQIRAAIRGQASPRHVPDQIVAMPGVPHTLTGKKLEVPVKRLLQGVPIEQVANAGAIDNPELLAAYQEWASGLSGRP